MKRNLGLRRPAKLSLYEKVRDYVDADLRSRHARLRRNTPFLAVIPLVLMALAHRGLPPLLIALGWVLACTLSVAWIIFTAIRGYHAFVYHCAKGDQAFDEQEKFELGPEYWTSESVSAAKRRKALDRQTGA